jgi:hypothetical protein
MKVIRLKHEWRGHPMGSIIKVTDNFANTMFQSDNAEKMETENDVSIKDKIQRMVDGKMVKPSINKKIPRSEHC